MMATKDYSSVQEELVASALGGVVVAASGSRPCVPGDVRTEKWLVECKTHTTPQSKIFFDLDVWKKIQQEADATHRMPALVADDGTQKLKNTWVLCRPACVDCSSMGMADPNFAIRKNISFDNVKVSEYLKSLYISSKGSALFSNMCLEINWSGETVLVMPFDTFTKVNDR